MNIDNALLTIKRYGYDFTNDFATVGGVDDKSGDAWGFPVGAPGSAVNLARTSVLPSEDLRSDMTKGRQLE